MHANFYIRHLAVIKVVKSYGLMAGGFSMQAMAANVVTCAYLLYTHVALHGVAGSFRKVTLHS
jgi:hypothetical protein